MELMPLKDRLAWAAFIELIQAPDDASNFPASHKFITFQKNEKRARRVQSYLDTKRTSRRK